MEWEYNNWITLHRQVDGEGSLNFDKEEATVEALRAIAEQLEKIHEDLYHISVKGEEK